MSKGSNRRPEDREKIEKNWGTIFGNKNKNKKKDDRSKL
jgi:hypothetical protein